MLTKAVATMVALTLALPVAESIATDVSAAPAARQYGGPCVSATVAPNPVTTRASVRVSGTGARANSAGQVTFGEETATFTATAAGAFAVSIAAPSTIGDYTLEVRVVCSTSLSTLTLRYSVRVVQGKLAVPGPPQNVSATRDGGRALVTWSAPTTGGTAETYRVQTKRRQRNGQWSEWETWGTTSSTSYGRKVGKRPRRFSVIAINAAGESGRSDVARLPRQR